MVLAFVLALVGSLLAQEAEDNRFEELKALLRAGKYAEAGNGARTLLADVEAARGIDSVEVAVVLDVLVESLWRGGKAREPGSRELAERAVAIKEKALGPQHSEVAASLNNLAALLRDTGDYAIARPLYERALAMREKALGPEHPDVASSLNNLAILLRDTGHYAAARPLYERALAIREKALGPDHPEVAASLNNLAGLLRNTGNYAAARPLYERALAIREKTYGPDHPDVAAILNNLGGVLRDTGDYAAGRPLYERALAIWEKSLGPDHPNVAAGLNSLALLLRNTGDYAAARPLYERALAIREKSLGPGHPDVATSLSNLANLLRDIGDYAAARPSFERALAIREKALGADHRNVAASLNDLAGLLRDTGDYTAARPLFERGLAIQEKALGPDHPAVAASLNDLAGLFRDTSNYAAARPLFERALAIQEKAFGPDHPGLAAGLTNLANLLRDTGDHAAARPLLERALSILETKLGPEHPDVATTLNDLAGLLQDVGDHAAARSLFERALSIWPLGPDHPAVATSLSHLAQLRATQGETAGALDQALEAERIAREHLQSTGRVLSERQALRYADVRTSGLDLVLTLAGRGLDAPSRRRAFDALVRSRAVVLDEMAARHHAVHAANDPEVERLAASLSTARSRLAKLVIRGLGEQKPESYRQLLDEARNEKELAERGLAGASVSFARELSQGQAGLDEVAKSLPQGTALVAFAQHTKIDLTPKSPPTASPGRAAKPAPVASYLGIVLRSGERDPQVVDLGAAREIDALVARWKQEASSGSGEAAYREAGARLRKKVWDPLAAALAEVARVFVVPDGSLNLVNLAALPLEDGGYLIERGPLLHYVSAERDLVPSAEVRRGEGLLVLGGPSYDATSLFASLRKEDVLEVPSASAATYRGQHAACGDFASVRFEPLPATAKESREIVRLWEKHEGSTKSETVLDLREAAASETALKRSAPGRRVLHLATHGFFLGGACQSSLATARGIGGLAEAPAAKSAGATTPVARPNPLALSGLALAGANHRSAAGEGEDDGILTAEEIASLDLSGVEWAVLSACETGVGDVRAGEGVFGLRRAFQVAGAGTLIMSLWSVDDEATRAWMKALYEGRLAKRLDTAEAVRRASLTVMAQRRKAGESTHPFYWAAFVAAGDWK